MAGRPAKATHHVEKLCGSRQAKARMNAIFETLAGTKSVRDAAQDAGLGEARFAELRDRMLSGALAALEPRPPGRQPKSRDPHAAELDQLRARVSGLEIELFAAQVREEIARVMPEVLVPPSSLDKGGRRKERRRRRTNAERRSGSRRG